MPTPVEYLRRLASEAVNALLLKGDVDALPSLRVRQFFASCATTLLDIGIFQSLLWSGWPSILWSTGIAFCVAVVFNYLLASGYVFRHRMAGRLWSWPRFITYTACALVSLCLNQLIIWLLAIRMGILPILAKCVAVACLFFFNLWAARRVIFAPSAPARRE